MTEQEYITVGDYGKVTHAREILKDICIPNQSCIDQGEYQKVMKYLRAWQQKLSKSIKVTS